MDQYAIFETDDGMTVVTFPAGGTAEEEAALRAAILIDPGPYATYEEAYEAMLALAEDDEDE